MPAVMVIALSLLKERYLESAVNVMIGAEFTPVDDAAIIDFLVLVAT